MITFYHWVCQMRRYMYTENNKSLLTADIKHEPLADHPDKQLLSNSADPFGVALNEQFSSSDVILEASGSKLSQMQFTNLMDYGKTLLPSSNIFDYRRQTSLVRDPKISQNCYSNVSNTDTSALYSRKVLHYRRKENLSSSTVKNCQNESELIDERGTSQTRVCLPEELNKTMYTKNSDAECTKKHQFMNVHGTVDILDHIDSTKKKKNTRIVHTNKNPTLNMNNQAKDCDKINPIPDGQLYFTENTDLNIEESIVANCKLPFEIQLLHDTNRTLNEEISECDNEGNQMDDINQSLNFSSVQNQIKIENIDQISDISNGQKEIETDNINQTSYLSQGSNIKMESKHQTTDILHAQKEMETDDINRTPNLSNRSTIKMENIDQTSDILQGQKQTQIQVLTNGNFTDCNDIENQTLVIRTKKENIQDETPTLNHYHENMREFEQTTWTHNLHLDHSNDVHKDGINKSCFKEYQILTAFVHDHTYYNVPQEDWKTDIRVKEIKHLLHRKNMLIARRNKLKEYKSILKERRKEEKLKAKLKAIEENRKLKLQKVRCSICEKMILRKFMEKHKRTCSEEPFLCTFCGKLLQSKRELYFHELFNHDERPKNCDICHKTFKSRFVLISHMREIHMKDKSKQNFLCSICGKTFANGKDLKRHTWTHSDERPFKCSDCDADFKIKRYLQQHISTCHVSGEIFMCTESGCERKYTTKNGLHSHMKWHHVCKIDERPFKCSYCDADFKIKRYLSNHIRRCHFSGKIFVCTESGCERKYTSKDGLRRHVKWHQQCKTDEGPLQIGFCHNSGKIFSCTESGCEKKYKRKDSLRKHVKWHQYCKTGENPFKCGFCYAEFKLRSSLQSHIHCCHDPEKMYSCTESGCERKYKSKYSLQRHVKWHQKCKTATGPINPTQSWSGKENSILRAVFKKEISGNKRIDIEKMRWFIKKYPWVLKDVQTLNDLRLKRIRTKLYMERFINKHPAFYRGKTNTPSEPSDSDSSETEPSDSYSGETKLSDSYSGETEPSNSYSGETEPSDSYSNDTEPSDSNSGETVAHVHSEPSDSNSG